MRYPSRLAASILILLALFCLPLQSRATTDAESRITNIDYTIPSYDTSIVNARPNVTYVYDPTYGRLETANNGITKMDLSSSTSYDDLGNVMSFTKDYYPPAGGSVAFAPAFAYVYYPDGSLKTKTFTIGSTPYESHYYYDGLDRMTGLVDPASNTMSWLYYPNSWLYVQYEYAGSTSGTSPTTSVYTYNQRGFLTDLSNFGPGGVGQSEFGSTGSSNKMTYDAAGNLLTMPVWDSYSSLSGTNTYTYNTTSANLDQLTQESSTRNGGYTENYAYDSAGNPTEFRGTTIPTANADNQVVVSGVSAYDGDGNPTTYDGVYNQFDAENRLTSFNATISGASMTAGWGVDGMRAWTENSSGAFNYDFYDGDEYIGSAPTTTNTLSSYNTYGPTGLLSYNYSSGTAFYTFDPQGNQVYDANSSGTTFWPGMSDAFGLVEGTSTTAGGYGLASYYDEQQGVQYDGAAGLMLMGNRDYDPATGRFLTRDPIGYDGGMNLYAFTDDNPVGSADPDGTTIVPPTTKLGLAYYNQAIAYLDHSNTAKKMINELQQSKTDYYIIPKTGSLDEYGDRFDPGSHRILWFPLIKISDVDNSGKQTGSCETPALALAHELAHAYDFDTNKSAFNSRALDTTTVGPQWDNAEEQWDITHFEDPIAIELNNANALPSGLQEGTRMNHRGIPRVVSGPTEFDYNGQF